MRKFILASLLILASAIAGAQVFQVDSSGNVTSSASFISTGGNPGQLTLMQGSPPVMPSVNSFSLVTPPSIPTSYQTFVPSAAANGLWRGTVGSGAGGTVTASGGVLQTSGISISSGGTGYTVLPACWVTASTGIGGTCAASTINTSGQVTGATIVTGGTGYPNTGAVLHFGTQVQMAFAELSGDATTSSTTTTSNQVTVIGIQGNAVSGIEGSASNKVQLTAATSTTNNDVVTYDGSGNVKDSGTLLTSLAQTGVDISTTGNKVIGIQGNAVSGIEGSASNKVQLTAATSTTNNDVVTYDGSGNVGDSGTLLSSLEHVLFTQFSTSDSKSCNTTEADYSTSYSIPSSYIVANKLLRVTIGVSLTSNGSPPGMAFNLKLGSTTVYTATQTAPPASLTTVPGGVTFYIQGTAAAGASVSVFVHPILSPAINGTAGVPFDGPSVAQPVAGIATNTSLAIKAGLVCSATSGTTGMTLNQMVVEALN